MAQGLTGAIIDSGTRYQTLAAAGSTTLANTDWHVIIITTSPPLATATIVMPPNPLNGQIVNVRADGAITTLTVSPNSGQSLSNNPATLAAGGIMEAIYRASNTTWYF